MTKASCSPTRATKLTVPFARRGQGGLDEGAQLDGDEAAVINKFVKSVLDTVAAELTMPAGHELRVLDLHLLLQMPTTFYTGKPHVDRHLYDPPKKGKAIRSLRDCTCAIVLPLSHLGVHTLKPRPR